nr:MAG TPA: hypothetical protein [Caudoviricetes sp.]
MLNVPVLATGVKGSRPHVILEVGRRHSALVVQQTYHIVKLDGLALLCLCGGHVELSGDNVDSGTIVDVLPECDALIVAKGQITRAEDSGIYPRLCIVNKGLVQKKFLLTLGSVPEQMQDVSLVIGATGRQVEQFGRLFQKRSIRFQTTYKEGKKLLQMGGQKFAGRVGGIPGHIECLSKVNLTARLAGVVDSAHIVHDTQAVFHLLPAGYVVLNLDRHTLHESRELRLRLKCRVELVKETGVGLVQSLLVAVPQFKRVTLLDFVHIKAVTVHQSVGVLLGVNEVGLFELAREEGDFPHEQPPILTTHFNGSKAARIGAAIDDGAGHHVRKGLQSSFFAGRKTHLTDIDKGRGIHGGDSPLARDVLQDGVDDGVDVLRTEHVSLCKGGHIVFRFCHSLHPLREVRRGVRRCGRDSRPDNVIDGNGVGGIPAQTPRRGSRQSVQTRRQCGDTLGHSAPVRNRRDSRRTCRSSNICCNVTGQGGRTRQRCGLGSSGGGCGIATQKGGNVGLGIARTGQHKNIIEFHLISSFPAALAVSDIHMSECMIDSDTPRRSQEALCILGYFLRADSFNPNVSRLSFAMLRLRRGVFDS